MLKPCSAVILRYLSYNNPATYPKLASVTHANEQTVRKHVKFLIAWGLAKRSRIKLDKSKGTWRFEIEITEQGRRQALREIV